MRLFLSLFKEKSSLNQAKAGTSSSFGTSPNFCIIYKLQ